MGNGGRKIDLDNLKNDILRAGGSDIIEIHDLNVVQPSIDLTKMSVHIRSSNPMKTLALVTDMCRSKHGIYDTAI